MVKKPGKSKKKGKQGKSSDKELNYFLVMIDGKD